MEREVNKELMNNCNKVLASSIVDLEEKKYLVKLKKIYFKVNNIEDIREYENRLYNNKSKKEKIDFEIERINLKIKTSDGQVVDALINKVLENMKNSKFSDDICDEIINSIIRIEVDLGLEIGLFEEFEIYFQDEVNKYLELIGDKRVEISYEDDMMEELYVGVVKRRINKKGV